MILVDSSVWIYFFNEADTLASLQLVKLLQVGDATVGTADLVIFEVLRGFRQGKAVQIAQSYLLDLPTVDIGGIHNAALAAEHYRYLRSRGHTIRSPIDVLLASGPARTEILVTTSIESDERVLARTSDVYSIDQGDVALYLPRVPAVAATPVKTWRVVP